MKKILLITICIILCFAMFACSSSKEIEETDTSTEAADEDTASVESATDYDSSYSGSSYSSSSNYSSSDYDYDDDDYMEYNQDYHDDYSWDNYDSNDDGGISGSEFQDAVNDYMDKMGY